MSQDDATSTCCSVQLIRGTVHMLEVGGFSDEQTKSSALSVVTCYLTSICAEESLIAAVQKALGTEPGQRRFFDKLALERLGKLLEEGEPDEDELERSSSGMNHCCGTDVRVREKKVNVMPDDWMHPGLRGRWCIGGYKSKEISFAAGTDDWLKSLPSDHMTCEELNLRSAVLKFLTLHPQTSLAKLSKDKAVATAQANLLPHVVSLQDWIVFRASDEVEVRTRLVRRRTSAEQDEEEKDRGDEGWRISGATSPSCSSQFPPRSLIEGDSLFTSTALGPLGA
eukprot:TRINITY_DN5390_c0_g1_i1.p1 TRINITY_DN5390_c0_g1~~TRINITY_DN5390_c0_g1_i1.p1  ORF type:complete len:282 (+),score=53.72 TRINITY_DN5390_c0_g1_i1:45-890(+)